MRRFIHDSFAAPFAFGFLLGLAGLATLAPADARQALAQHLSPASTAHG